MAQTPRHEFLYAKFYGKSVLGLLCFFITILAFSTDVYSQAVSIASGNWSATSTWSGGVLPSANQSVTISATHTVNVDINTPTVGNVTVNGNLTILNTATSTLTYNGNMVVNSGGILNNQGGIVQASSSNKTFQLAGTASYTHNPRNVTLIDETIFSKSNEVFSSTSSLIIQKWFDVNKPLGASDRVQQPLHFGNVTMNIPDLVPWEQDNQFMDPSDIPRIDGTLTVSSGIVRMEEGTSASPSTFMQFNNVLINGTGSIIFSSGSSRPFVLVTGNFTDVSTSTNPTVIMDNVFGFTQWNVNGSAQLGHNFYGIVGSGVNPGGSLNVQITGNLDITGGSVQFISMASAPLTLTVNGNTTISGSPTKVRFIDGNLGNLTFTTNNFTISGGGDNILMGGNGLIPQATGVPSININNDFIISAASNTVILDASTTTQKLRLKIGHDFNITGTNSNITAAKSKGAVTVYVTNACTLTAGKFIGQIDTLNNAIDSVFIGSNFLMNAGAATSDYFRINYGTGSTFFRCNGNFTLQNSGTGQGIGFCGIFAGSGAMNFNVVGIYTMNAGRFSGIYNNRANIQTGTLTFTVGTNFNFSGGYFRGIDNRVSVNAGVVNFTVGNLLYSGGNFSGYYAVNSSAGTSTFNINGLFQITFASAATDTFTFVGVTSLGPEVSNMKLSVTVTGNFNITGPNGAFISSLANGREVVNVTGSMNISGGKDSFNSYPNSGLPNSHPVILNINTDLVIFGGSMYLSANNDSLVATVGGNLNISLGELVLQGGNTTGTVNVIGGFNMSGGNLFFHKNSTASSYSPIEMTINSDNNNIGDFLHSGGVINFDDNTTSTQVFLNIYSPNIVYSGNGSMTMANPGTNLYSGVIRYGKTGTANFSRLSATHSIQQVDQQIMSGCTLVVINGNLQIASYYLSSTSKLLINSGAVLDLQGNQVFSNALQPYSGFLLFGKIRTSKPQGFYDGSANAAINANGGMNYLMLSNSTVEYYGTATQVITGIGVGAATGSAQKYYNLEVNNTGTPDVNFVYPTDIPNTRSVFVRNKLTIIAGELNLDNDHNPVSGGRSIIIERDSLSAITRIAGFIRSESYDSSASVIWRVNSRTGLRIIPFGYNSSSYIPFWFDLASGDADTLFVSTYHTPAANNLPYPPPVPHVHDLAGADNSANTVDRFWYIRSTGTSTNANLRFVVTPLELGLISNPRAQAWITTAPQGWTYPLQGTQSTVAFGTSVTGAFSYQNNWWTLAGLNTPLPVSFLDFTSSCRDSKTVLNWSTGSEQNNRSFTIMKSINGAEYKFSGAVTGAGNSSDIRHYSFTDPEINNKPYYYKLIQTDYDGRETEYGPIVSTVCKFTRDLEVNVYPVSPGELNVIIKNPDSGQFRVDLFSVDGKPIMSREKNLDSGMNIVSLETPGLATGIYFVRVTGNNASITTKVPVGFTR